MATYLLIGPPMALAPRPTDLISKALYGNNFQ
jgi:hypothetical protein